MICIFPRRDQKTIILTVEHERKLSTSGLTSTFRNPPPPLKNHPLYRFYLEPTLTSLRKRGICSLREFMPYQVSMMEIYLWLSVFVTWCFVCTHSAPTNPSPSPLPDERSAGLLNPFDLFAHN